MVLAIRDSLPEVRRSLLLDAIDQLGRSEDLEPNGNGQIDVSGFLDVQHPKIEDGTVTILDNILWDKENDKPYSDILKGAKTVSDRGFEKFPYTWQRVIAFGVTEQVAIRFQLFDIANFARKEMNSAKRKAFNSAPPALHYRSERGLS
jgi:hypothetical protein